jgi:hypothetical protein
MSEDGFDEAKRVSAEGWARDLARLERGRVLSERARSARLDLSGRLIHVSSPDREGLVSLDTGEPVFEVASGSSAGDWVPFSGGFFLKHDAEGLLGRVELLPSGRAIERREPVLGLPEACAPDGSAVLVSCDEKYDPARMLGIYRWPSLEPLLEVSLSGKGVAPRTVDWATRRLLVRTEERRVRVITFGKPRRPELGLDLADEGSVFEVIGPGVACESGRALALHFLEGGSTWPLAGSAASSAVSLSTDGSRLRALVGTAPARFRLDLGGKASGLGFGKATSEPLVADGAARWHPHADVLAAGRRVVAFDGTLVLELPPSARADAWTPDGRGLVVLSDGGGDRDSRVELWRIP